MIAAKPTFPAYLAALLPQDQIFDPEELDYEHTKAPEDVPRKRLKSEKTDTKEENAEAGSLEEPIKMEENTSSAWDIDNPYLAATKLPSKEHE